MKKYSFFGAFLMLVMLIFVLSSCGDAYSKDKSKDKDIEEETTAAVTEEITGEEPVESTTVPTTETTTEPSESETESTSEEVHEHYYGQWVTVQEPTCKAQGKKERVCTCGSKESDTVEIVAHKYQNGVCTMCKQSEPKDFVPDYSVGNANTVGNQFSNCANYTSQADWIYFLSSSNQISKMKKDGTKLTQVYKASAGKLFKINVVGDWIYFYCQGQTEAKSYIGRVRTDGSNFEKILSSTYVYDMLVVKDRIFFTIENWKYDDYGKDAMPLYCVSVNGGLPTQIHDGFVLSITADTSYVYFLHVTEDDEKSIYRMKHDGTKKTALLSKTDINYFTLKDSKLFFLTFDKYSYEYSIASISTSGGGYTVHGKIPFYSEYLYIIGQKAYYNGAPYVADGFSEECGHIEYDMTKKTYKVIKEDYEITYLYFTSDMLIEENYNGEILESITVYDSKGNKKQIKVK